MSFQSRVDDSAPIVEDNGPAQPIQPFQRAEFVAIPDSSFAVDAAFLGGLGLFRLRDLVAQRTKINQDDGAPLNQALDGGLPGVVETQSLLTAKSPIGIALRGRGVQRRQCGRGIRHE